MKGAASVRNVDVVEDSQAQPDKDNEFKPTVVEAIPEPLQEQKQEPKSEPEPKPPKTKTKAQQKLVDEVIEQSDRIADALTSDIDESLREEIKYICLNDEFTIDGYNLKWNRLSKNLINKVDDVIRFKTMPDTITDPSEKQDWMLKNYFKLVFENFTDDMYYNMSIPALKVLEQAPHARIRGLFRRR
jgi:hypothetical protein